MNNKKVYIIAEAGVNHNGCVDTALKMIRVAKDAGVDAVKFQTFSATKSISKLAKMAKYQIKNTGKVESQLDMVKKYELTFEEHLVLKKYADEIGIEFLSSPFDMDSVELLEKLGVSMYKIASGEIVNHPLLRLIAKKNKPIIMSTGMSTIGEIEEAINIIEKEQNYSITLLQCTSNYPPKYENVNLNVMGTLEKCFQYPIGYSDHTIGDEIAIAAVALGATIIEKHFTLDKNMEGPDHLVSLEPTELSKMVQRIRNVELAMGDYKKTIADDEIETRLAARKSIVASKKIIKGSLISLDDITLKRPGTGLLPKYIDNIIGRKVSRNIEPDDLITYKDLV